MRSVLAFTCFAALSFSVAVASSPYRDWQHSGSLFILTTSEGANLADGAAEENFPLLVRLHSDWFDFSQAEPDGRDLRFASATGEPLPFQLEHWDADAGSAAAWVRVPRIQGNARQEIRMYWGQPDAIDASNGTSVFNASNGYLSVWHLGDEVRDEVGTLESSDTGTTTTAGIVGKARHFSEQHGIFCGDNILAYPTGNSAHSTQCWFRPQSSGGRVLGWGNEQAQGKVVMQYRSPPRVQIDAYFSDANVSADLVVDHSETLPEWIHAVHTYRQGQSQLYLNGVLASTGNARAAPLSVQRPAKMWIGGWYNRYDFVGDIDEVRISNVERSADWVRLEYENQKPLQSLVGPLVQPGTEFGVSESEIVVPEGQSAPLSAQAGGAQKVYWILTTAERETVVAVDRFQFTFTAPRVRGDQALKLQFKAVYSDQVKTVDIPVTIKEAIPEPIFTLDAPSQWNGRESIEVVPQISNLEELQAHGVGELACRWKVSGLAVSKQVAPGKLILRRAHNSGALTVTASIDNGGEEISSATQIVVQEREHDAWVRRTPGPNEQPVDHQFYARDDQNQGTLFCNGTLADAADAAFLKLYADDTLLKTEHQQLTADNAYAFTIKLRPGLIRYRVEWGSITGGAERILHTAEDIVCGDVYIIQGQSNALATDTQESSPPKTNPWVRSYGNPGDKESNLWCNPVWKARQGEKAELGYWGMELAERLVASQRMPICIFNGAVGGTRIDQHQRNENDPVDLQTIYGRLLWRVREARLTHGIRAVLWHQGESDQGADGPDGDYGWKTYQQYFVDMAAAWKEDFPNLQHYYVFQIWPNACSMGNGNGDMLREVQRTLPHLYSNMDIMSTLGIRPPGGCHYPLVGWAEFARLMQPLIERDFHGVAVDGVITPPNLQRASYTSDAQDSITLEFDQPVLWDDSLIHQFYLDGMKDQVAAGSVSGNTVLLKLKSASKVQKITYLKEMEWSQEHLLMGTNGIAALTFCEVPLAIAEPSATVTD